MNDNQIEMICCAFEDNKFSDGFGATAKQRLSLLFATMQLFFFFSGVSWRNTFHGTYLATKQRIVFRPVLRDELRERDIADHRKLLFES